MISLVLDNLESDIRTLATSFEEYKEFIKMGREEIYRFKEEMRGRLRVEERRGTQEERFMEIVDPIRALDGKKDRQLIQINSQAGRDKRPFSTSGERSLSR